MHHCLVVFVIAFLINLLVLRLALDYFHLNKAASQIAATASYTLLMYILTRLFVFDIVKATEQDLEGKQ